MLCRKRPNWSTDGCPVGRYAEGCYGIGVVGGYCHPLLPTGTRYVVVSGQGRTGVEVSHGVADGRESNRNVDGDGVAVSVVAWCPSKLGHPNCPKRSCCLMSVDLFGRVETI